MAREQLYKSDRRLRVCFVNRSGQRQRAVVTDHVARKLYSCSACRSVIERGARYWLTSNVDGRLCATCVILNLDV